MSKKNIIWLCLLTACQMQKPMTDNNVTWYLITGNDHGLSFSPVQDYPITLNISSSGEWEGNAGINQYHFLNGKNEIITTRMAGKQQVMKIESIYLTALKKIKHKKEEDKQLYLRGEQVELIFQRY